MFNKFYLYTNAVTNFYLNYFSTRRNAVLGVRMKYCARQPNERCVAIVGNENQIQNECLFFSCLLALHDIKSGRK